MSIQDLSKEKSTTVSKPSVPALAEPLRYKNSGNRLFEMKNFAAALACYKRGLEELPRDYDRSGSGEEVAGVEVALRSNVALSLLKLANGGSVESADKKMHCCIECEQECTRALAIDPSNTKVLFRRAQAYELHARLTGGRKKQELMSMAQSDLKRCQELLQEQLDRQKWSNPPEKERKATISQMYETTNLLKKISQNSKVSGGSKPGDSEKSVPPSERQSTQQKVQKSIVDPCTTANGIVMNGYHSRPSPSHQREVILQLLARKKNNGLESHHDEVQIFRPLVNEAFFLLNMNWWEQWCRHVDFFKFYTQGDGTSCNNGRDDDSGMVDAGYVAEVDHYNKRMLALLPPGATIPPYIEKDRKEKIGVGEKDEKRRGSLSSSSSDSSNGDSVRGNGDANYSPGVIDNSSLLIEDKSRWGYDFSGESDDRHGTHHQPLLRRHLVRGYHFEIIPREAYAALRTWYGEASPQICRRALDPSKRPWANIDNYGPSVWLLLYPEYWDIINKSEPFEAERHRLPGKVSRCGACRSPNGRFICKRCSSIRYCNKNCQMSHWQYHKSACQLLNKRREEKLSSGEDLRGLDDAGLIPDDSLWGRVGLNNLGNTCFMSSALQCMSHVLPLTRYFLSNKFERDINLNNILGTGGKVARAYGALLRDIWMGAHQHRSLSPNTLKRAIELFAPRFSGVSQQDSAEFLAYLLDALHEDLNRIRNPPYVEMPGVEKGKKLSICGAEAWDAMSLRNSSFIFDNFYGLYKSTCVCPQCEEVSVTFETFNHITLEIPRQLSIDVVVVLVKACDESPCLPIRYCLQVHPNGVMKDLKAKLSQLSGVHLSKLTLCNVHNHFINKIFNDNEFVSVVATRGIVFAYETAPHDDPTQVHVVASHNFPNGNDDTRFGIPFLMSFDASLTCATISNIIWERVKPFLKVGRTRLPENFTLENVLDIRVVGANGKAIINRDDLEPLSVAPTGKNTFIEILGDECKSSFIFLLLEWSSLTVDNADLSRINYNNFESVTDHSTFSLFQQNNGTKAVTLDECFTSFTQPERLDDDNMWYCTHCKEHVRAMKTVCLWRLPNILVVHLKRFEYRNSFNREKIGVLVDFPLEGLDLGKHAASESPDFVVDVTPAVYDLFGVTNHYGRMGFGHYTAYARRWDESGVEDTWIEFDDENVSPLDTPSNVVSAAAYVLFYKKRDII
mmetsp:Transcript_6615/g.13554  ORF Transcript_6615/g.13554 Transcript_6615/m.13554 type:complete len:1188 (+) Transcript_6615:229-3792(+)